MAAAVLATAVMRAIAVLVAGLCVGCAVVSARLPGGTVFLGVAVGSANGAIVVRTVGPDGVVREEEGRVRGGHIGSSIGDVLTGLIAAVSAYFSGVP